MPLPEGVFGWGELLDAGVALATLALAGVTAWMAKETRRVAKAAALESQAVQDEASATLEMVALTRVQLQSAQRPLLMDVPVGVFVERWMGRGLFGGNQPRPQARDLGEPTIWFPSDGTEVEISVPLRNVGPGIAFIRLHVSAVTWTISPGEQKQTQRSRAGKSESCRLTRATIEPRMLDGSDRAS